MNRGIKIVSGGTDNHLMLVDLTNFDQTGKAVEKLLDSVNITCNKNTIPNDPKSPFVTRGDIPRIQYRGYGSDCGGDCHDDQGGRAGGRSRQSDCGGAHRKISVKIKSFKVCRLGFRAYCECSICAEAFLMFYSTKIIKN